MVGLRFPGGSCFFPGFGKGISFPCFISFGCSPVFAISLKISAMPSHSISGPYLTISALRLSTPGLLLFFKECADFGTSSPVNGIFISLGGILGISYASLDVDIFSKKFDIMLTGRCCFSSSYSIVHPSIIE